MLNLSRRHAAWLFSTLIVLLIVLFILVIWLFVINANSTAELPTFVALSTANHVSMHNSG